MLELKSISKRYETAGFAQTALDDVSLAFRDNEFVAILGPSGSGKTTMLNIIGGLDRFDSGDLVIDGISTEKFKDRDWDAYRNNRIGFVFQSYNLIPHQSVLANVELALTLSGVGKAERYRRAQEALERVGLAEHANKRPGQLSGGQMQRVAIARALVNEPEILLADEPTGALDSTTSLEVMDLLKEVANDRLVVMVTHNPDLAHTYATRIVELSDGRVTSDSDPFDAESAEHREAKAQRRTSMGFWTALTLSFNNLMTKKGRTFMTAFAGSIGIIGIAAVLALATGANNYIQEVEEDMLSVYPLTISTSGLDISSVLAEQMNDSPEQPDIAENRVDERRTMTKILSRVGNNDLASLKEFFDGGGDGIDGYVSEIAYQYDVSPQIFLADTSDGVRQVSPDTSLSAIMGGSSGSTGTIQISGMSMSASVFNELPASPEIFADQYDVCAGRWPEAADELVLVLSRFGTVSDVVEYGIGLRDHVELEDMVKKFISGEEIEDPVETKTYTYDDLMGCTFKLVAAGDMYEYEPDYDLWTSKADDEAYMKKLVDGGEELHIVGVVRPKEGQDATSLMQGVYYTPALVEKVAEEAAESDVVKVQLADPEYDVLSGKRFDEETNDSSLGLETLIDVDGEKLRASFTFDESKVKIDFSGLDFSGISFDSILENMPAPDASSISSSISQPISSERLSQIINESWNATLASGAVSISSEGQRNLERTLASIYSYYPIYALTHLGTSIEDYLATDSVRQQLSEAASGLFDMSAVSSQLASQVSSRIQSQVVPELSQQLSAAINDYVQNTLSSYLSQGLNQLRDQATEIVSQALEGATENLIESASAAMGIDEEMLESAFSLAMTKEELTELVMAMMGRTTTSYESNLAQLGYVDFDTPSEIDIYPTDFEAKKEVISIIDGYNERMSKTDESKVVSYTDIVGVLMNSVTEIIEMISTLLIAFVSISLVVSCIMIAVITYISVLERKKEIGVLRSIGASKGDVSRVFNAETIIEGLVAGLLGVGITYIGSTVVNIIVKNLFGVEGIMRLELGHALMLIAVSVALTLLAGLVPSRAAAKADPVEALRSE